VIDFVHAIAAASLLVLAGCHPPGQPTSRPALTSTSASKGAHPRSTDFADARIRMVQEQLIERDITDPRVLKAMRDVPRHWFVPEAQQLDAYKDRPLPIGYEQTISQPYIVALMTQLLAVRPGDKVLEIGTGSGYQAAVLSELTPDVYTIEIVEPLARRTIELFKQKGYDNIHARIGDGFRGWPEAAPFDAIIVTCAAPRPPQPLVDQLRVGGSMVIPVDASNFGQELVVYTKRADKKLDRRIVAPVIFVPMTGEAAKSKR